MNDKLKAAGQNYGNGFTCSQSVFCAYADEMGIDPDTACRMMEGFGGGMGGLQEVCGALAAACAIVSYYSCDGKPDMEKRQETYAQVRKAAELFRHEYGGITCREVLHGEKPKAFQCGMKIKDTVMIIERLLSEMNPDTTETNVLGGLSPEDALEYMKKTPNLVIVQVNTAEWYIEDGFKDALWIPHTEIAERYDEIPKGVPIILHCGAGVVSVPAYETLVKKRPDIPELSYIAGRPPIAEYNEWLENQ